MEHVLLLHKEKYFKVFIKTILNKKNRVHVDVICVHTMFSGKMIFFLKRQRNVLLKTFFKHHFFTRVKENVNL
jgi:hypothetical protein